MNWVLWVQCIDVTSFPTLFQKSLSSKVFIYECSFWMRTMFMYIRIHYLSLPVSNDKNVPIFNPLNLDLSIVRFTALVLSKCILIYPHFLWLCRVIWSASEAVMLSPTVAVSTATRSKISGYLDSLAIDRIYCAIHITYHKVFMGKYCTLKCFVCKLC